MVPSADADTRQRVRQAFPRERTKLFILNKLERKNPLNPNGPQTSQTQRPCTRLEVLNSARPTQSRDTPYPQVS